MFSPDALSGGTLIAMHGPIKVHWRGRAREGTTSWNVCTPYVTSQSGLVQNSLAVEGGDRERKGAGVQPSF